MLNRLKVRTKIILLSTILILLLILITYLGFVSLEKSNTNLTNMYSINLMKTRLYNDNRAQQRAIEADIYYIILNSGEQELQNQKLDDVETRKTTFDKNIEEIKKLGLSVTEQNLIQSLNSELATFREGRNLTVDLALAGKRDEAMNQYDMIADEGEKIQSLLIELSKDQNTVAESTHLNNDIQFKTVITIYIVVLGFSILFAIGTTLLISKSITTPLKQTVHFLKVLATGDFSSPISQNLKNRRDEIGELINATDTMQSAVYNLIHNLVRETDTIREVLEDVNGNVIELNSEVEGVSATTEELAASMEETAASTQEMTAMSKEMERSIHFVSSKADEGAQKAVEISLKATQVLAHSTSNQKEAVSMIELTSKNLKNSIEKAKAVEEIKVLALSIKQITEQTNLLSLNAAIEAARAGEAGNGFRVVAEEIRKLAEASKIAVNKIQQTTEVIISSVEDLSSNSEVMLNFMENQILSDYKTLVQTSSDYSNDAHFFKDTSTDLSATSEELLSILQEFLKTIDGVAVAANEGAEGTSDIANRTASVTLKSNAVMTLVDHANETAAKLKAESDQFKI